MPRESKDAIVKLLLLSAVELDESGNSWASKSRCGCRIRGTGGDGHAIEGWACKTSSRSICRSEWLALWRCHSSGDVASPRTGAEHSSASPFAVHVAAEQTDNQLSEEQRRDAAEAARAKSDAEARILASTETSQS